MNLGLVNLYSYQEGEDEEGEKSLVDQTKEFMAGFDEEEKLELKEKFNSVVGAVGLVGSAGEFLSKYALDPDTAASACVVFSAASSVASLKIPDITTQQILMTVKKIEKGVDKILKTPLKTALENFDYILDAVETGNFKIAYDKISVLEEDAMKAFHYMDEQDEKISIENYKECSKAVKLQMFSKILRSSYDQDRKIFITPERLQENQVLLIGKALEKIARKCIDQKENVKTKSWGFEKDSLKSEAQNCLDKILVLAYPYISRAKKLTDLNKQITMSDDELYKFRLLPELLPMGHEDKTKMTVGVITDEKGEKEIAIVAVWRDDTHVYFEHKGVWFYKPIISESAPVDMEDAESRITLSATGRAREESPGYLGDYTITGKEHGGRPVYRNSEGWYLYTMESGAWGVSGYVGISEPPMRSITPAPCPALCREWEYYDYGYKPGYVSVKCTIH